MMTIDHSETAAYLHCELGLTDFSSKILAAILLIADRTDVADIFLYTLGTCSCGGCAGGEIKLLPERP